MINPYALSEDDLRKIELAYKALPKEGSVTPKLNLLRPYQSHTAVIQALNDKEEPNKVFSKMSMDLRKDERVMTDLMIRDASAYLYVHPSINTSGLRQKAVYNNPSVYRLLSDDDRKEKETVDAYREGVLYNRSAAKKIDVTTEIMLFKHQLAENVDKEQFYSEENYRERYENLALHGPYLKDSVLQLQERNIFNQDLTFVATAKVLRPEMKARFLEIEKDVWKEHPERVSELAKNNRQILDIAQALTAIEERCPEYQPVIQEKQREYWKEREQELLELQEKEVMREDITRQERLQLEEARKHIELESKEKTKERVEQKIQQEREEEMAYIKASAISEAYGRASVGDIEFSAATDIAGNVGSIQNKVKASRSFEMGAHVRDQENDVHNIDENRENYLERTEGVHAYLVEDYGYEMATPEEREYEGVLEEIEEEEEYEYDPGDWKHSPPDVERFREWQ